MAQCDDKPAYVIFFCETPAAEGGATPIIPSHAVVRHLRDTAPEVAARLRKVGVRYVRVLPEEDDPSSPIGKSWKAAFDASTREQAEAAMSQAGTSFEWQADGSVKTVTKSMAALVRHEATGQEMFFNAVIAALTGWVDARNDPSKAVLYGDGSPLDDAAYTALLELAEWMQGHRVAFEWEAGDVLLIDNHKAMHSRETFVGPRKILASLWGDALDAPPDAVNFKTQPQEQERLAHDLEIERDLRTALPLRLSRGGRQLGKKLLDAIKLGYRHLDCACDYGNEAEVGAGIRQAIAEGLVTRDELWVTSKLWNTYHAKEHVELACRKTLDDLGLDYVDLYLVHFPIALKYVPFETRYPPEWIHDPKSENPTMVLEKVPMQETWEAMEALLPLGLAKNIGVCNFNTAGLRDLLSYATEPPAVLQVELHPFNQQPKLLRFCADEGIAVTGFSPLGAGSYVELDMATADDSALTNPQIDELARGKGVSPAQLILRWALQRGISIVPKSTKPERLQQNIDLDGFELSGEEMATMAVLDQGRRYNDPGVFCLGMGAFCPIYD